MYFSYNAGENWIKLNASAPTISYRDIELHERDHDLIGERLVEEYTYWTTILHFGIYPIWQRIKAIPFFLFVMLGGTSNKHHCKLVECLLKALQRTVHPIHLMERPLVTTYLNLPKTPAQQRQSEVKVLEAEGKDIPFPGWETLRADALEDAPKTLLLIKDASGEPVRWLEGGQSPGFHRTTWDLRFPAPDPISFSTPGFRPPWAGIPQGPLAAPGIYSVELYVLHNGKLQTQGGAQEFIVKPIPALEGRDFEETFAFHKELNDLSREMNSAGSSLGEASNRLRHIEAALVQTSTLAPELFEQLAALTRQQAELITQLYGDRIRRSKDISVEPAIAGRLNQVLYGLSETSLPPTQTHHTNVALASQGFEQFKISLQDFWSELEKYETQGTAGRSTVHSGTKVKVIR